MNWRERRDLRIAQQYPTMDKPTLVQEMKKAGVRDSRVKHPLWEEAFKQYNAANPNNKVQYSLCGSCFSKVSNWLNT